MTPHAPRRWARALLLAGFLLVATAALFGIAEGALRFVERRRASIPGTLPLIYYRHAWLHRALVRNADYFGWVHINSLGFRGPATTIAKRPGTLRVMVVGESTTFDPCAGRDAEAWPARLEFWVNASSPPEPVEVINAGVVGYLLLTNIMRLQSELHAFTPDVIVLYAGHNDLARALVSAHLPRRVTSTPDEAPTVTPWTAWLTRHSLLYNKVLLRAQALASRRGGGGGGPERIVPWPTVLDQADSAFRRDLRSFLLIARSLGIRVIVPELVQISGADPDLRDTVSVAAMGTTFAAPLEVTTEAYRRFASVARDVADSTGAVFVSTRHFGIVGQRNYCRGDPIHFNSAGAESMARQLAPDVRRVLTGATKRPLP